MVWFLGLGVQLILFFFSYSFCTLSTQVRVPLTNDYNKIAKNLYEVEPKGMMKFIVGIRIAHVSTLVYIFYMHALRFTLYHVPISV